MTPFEVLYGRVCISSMGWFEFGDVKPFWIESMKDNQDKVRRIQKKYADHKMRYMEFQMGQNILLKDSPMKGVMRFGKRGN